MSTSRRPRTGMRIVLDTVPKDTVHSFAKFKMQIITWMWLGCLVGKGQLLQSGSIVLKWLDYTVDTFEFLLARLWKKNVQYLRCSFLSIFPTPGHEHGSGHEEEEVLRVRQLEDERRQSLDRRHRWPSINDVTLGRLREVPKVWQ